MGLGPRFPNNSIRLGYWRLVASQTTTVTSTFEGILHSYLSDVPVREVRRNLEIWHPSIFTRWTNKLFNIIDLCWSKLSGPAGAFLRGGNSLLNSISYLMWCDSQTFRNISSAPAIVVQCQYLFILESGEVITARLSYLQLLISIKVGWPPSSISWGTHSTKILDDELDSNCGIIAYLSNFFLIPILICN